jgi:hypothetical protein
MIDLHQVPILLLPPPAPLPSPPPVPATAVRPPPPSAGAVLLPTHATAQWWITHGDDAQKARISNLLISHRGFYERDAWGSLLLTCAYQVLTLTGGSHP